MSGAREWFGRINAGLAVFGVVPNQYAEPVCDRCVDVCVDGPVRVFGENRADVGTVAGKVLDEYLQFPPGKLASYFVERRLRVVPVEVRFDGPAVFFEDGDEAMDSPASSFPTYS